MRNPLRKFSVLIFVAIALLATGRKGRKGAIPFGPFLAFGGVISLFWGRPLLAWYLGQ